MKFATLAPWLSGVLLGLFLSVATSAPAAPSPQERAEIFLRLLNAGYQAVARVESEAQWDAATDVTPVHDAAAEVAGKARAAFCGNPALIREARELLALRKKLKPVTARELEHALLNAAEGPMTNPELTAARIAAETQQSSTLNSFVFRLNGKPITPNEIDNFLQTNRDLALRQSVWEASKQSGPALKPGLLKLRDLRNGVARELGHADYFALQVAGYDMSAAEMLKKKGARKILACVSHAILNNIGVERLRKSPIDELVTTDTVLRPAISGVNLVTLSVAGLLGEAIKRIHSNSSVTSLFEFRGGRTS